MSYEWMIENEEFMMFVVVPILMIPVGWIVTKILNYYENQLSLLLTNADNYGIMINITKGNKMKTKELKEQLWQAYYTAKDEGASRKVTNPETTGQYDYVMKKWKKIVGKYVPTR